MATEEDFVPSKLTKLEKSPAGLFFVEDGEGVLYEIEEFLGDAYPICQVFRARYSFGNAVQGIVALKLARVDFTSEFMKLRQEVDNSFIISPYAADQENDDKLVNANNVVVGIYKSFYYGNLLCIVMPYMKGGSLRYNIYKRFPGWRLPERCIAVVLREILGGLNFLHGRERAHKKLNAGNIFIGDFNDPGAGGQMTIKLGYQGSTYFHDPQADRNIRIWDESWDPALGPGYLCVASKLQVNKFWTINGIYEPRNRDIQEITRDSDIWNVGVLALELAFGPFRYDRSLILTNYANLRKPIEFHTFLQELRNSEEIQLPRLFELFLQPRNVGAVPEESGEEEIEETNFTRRRNNRAATKMKKGLINAGKKMKGIMKKVEIKTLRHMPKSDPNPDPVEESRGEERTELADAVEESNREESEELDPNGEVELSNSFKAMVRWCLRYSPIFWPALEDLLNHPFFVENQDADLQYLRNYILSYPPTLRSNPNSPI